MAEQYFNSDINADGKIKLSTVPNSTGTVMTYNPTTKELSTRTNAQIISDLGLNSDLSAYVKKAGDTMTGSLTMNNGANVVINKDLSTITTGSGFARDMFRLTATNGIIDVFGWQGSVDNTGTVTFGYGYLGGSAYNVKNAIRWNSNQQVRIGSTGVPTGNYGLEVDGNTLSRGNFDSQNGAFNTVSGELLVQRFGVNRIRTNTASTIISGDTSNGIVYLRPQGDAVASSEVQFRSNLTAVLNDGYNFLFGNQTSTGSALFHTNLATNVAGYGLWMGHNLQFNGTDFIQPRGSLNSWGFTVNNHKKFSFNYAAANSTNGGVVTLSEVASIDQTGKITTLNTGSSDQWNSAYLNGFTYKSLIAAGTDLNTVTGSGWYIQGSNANATTALNYPVALAGQLKVYGVNTVHITQEYHVFSTNNDVYRRYYYNGNWSLWAKLWDSNDFTQANINAWNNIALNGATQQWVDQYYINKSTQNVVKSTDWFITDDFSAGMEGKFKFTTGYPRVEWGTSSVTFTDEGAIDIVNYGFRQEANQGVNQLHSATSFKDVSFNNNQGTSPFTVDSSTLVTNLNADLLDGRHASDFVLTSQVGNFVPYSGATSNVNLNNKELTNTSSLELSPTAKSLSRLGIGNNEKVHNKIYSGSLTAGPNVGILSFSITPPTASATMFDTTIKIYGYGSTSFAEFRISFYRQTVSIINTAGTSAGLWCRDNFPTDVVRVGFDPSGKIVINIGDITTDWSTYPSYEIERIETKFTGGTADWASGWTSALITDVTGYNLFNVPVERLASRNWVNTLVASSIPSNFITTNTTQTGLTGDKTTAGNWIFNGTGANKISLLRPGNTINNSISFGLDTASMFVGMADANNFAIGNNINLSSTPNRKLWVDFANNTINAIGQIGGSNLGARDIGGYSISTTTNNSRAEMIVRHNWSANNQTFALGGVSSPTAGSMSRWGMFKWLNDRTVNGNDGFFGWAGDTDTLQATALSGTGTRMVVASADGTLSTQAVPSSSVYTAGQGLTLTGNQFSIPITSTGTGTGVSNVTATATGLQITRENFVTLTTLNTVISNYVNRYEDNFVAPGDWSITANTSFTDKGYYKFTEDIGYPEIGFGTSKAIFTDEYTIALTNYGISQLPGQSGTNYFGSDTYFEFVEFRKPQGQAPFNVLSNTLVTNLNADYLDGYHASSFAMASQLSNYVPITRTITIDGVTKDLTANQSWTTNNTVTRLRGGGSFVSGDITINAGTNVNVSQSGQTITIASTDTNTTYTAGAGLTLTGTTFSLPVTISGTGNGVASVVQNASGITVNKTDFALSSDLTNFVTVTGAGQTITSPKTFNANVNVNATLQANGLLSNGSQSNNEVWTTDGGYRDLSEISRPDRQWRLNIDGTTTAIDLRPYHDLGVVIYEGGGVEDTAVALPRITRQGQEAQVINRGSAVVFVTKVGSSFLLAVYPGMTLRFVFTLDSNVGDASDDKEGLGRWVHVASEKYTEL